MMMENQAVDGAGQAHPPLAVEALLGADSVADPALEGEDLIEELADICRAVVIESERAFEFAGQRFEIHGHGPAPLIGHLQRVLYDQAYAQRFDYDRPAELRGPEPVNDPSFAAALAGIVPGVGGQSPSGFLDAGWQLLSGLGDGGIVAAKNGLRRIFRVGSYRYANPSTRTPLGVGSPIVVWWSRTSPWEQQGFFHVFSHTIPDDWESGNLVRLYWNLHAEEVVEKLADWVQRLDRFQVPYQLKTLSDPSHYRVRCDGTVLYFQRRHFAMVSRLALEAVTEPCAESEVPLFTRRLGPGLGVAEDPGTSFGMSRCGILAEALWNAYYLGRGDSVDGKMEEVREHFVRRGIDLERPYLNPMSADIYDTPCLEEGP